VRILDVLHPAAHAAAPVYQIHAWRAANVTFAISTPAAFSPAAVW